jgi:tetratricopeptide (TPR) repeat protein
MVEPGRQIFPVLSSQPFETWQIEVVPLPVWLPTEGSGTPSRACMLACLSVDSGKSLASGIGRADEIPSVLADLLSRAGREWHAQPARVQVADAGLADILEGILGPQGIRIETLAELPHLREIMGFFMDEMPQDVRPGPLTGAGVTVERLRAFAQAAAEFYDAPCWRLLTGDDMIQVEAPEVEDGLRFLSMNRSGGRSLTGLLFFLDGINLEALEGEVDRVLSEAGGLWTVLLELCWRAPTADLEIWDRHGFPWTGEGRCPVAHFLGIEGIERPDGRRLAFFEGLLAALAATTEEDLDSGRWTKQVSTASGPVRFVLSLPGLLEPESEESVVDRPLEPSLIWRFMERSRRNLGKLMEGQEFGSLEEANEVLASLVGQGEDSQAEPDTPQEKAEDLLDRAYAARGRRAVLLARQALEVWPDCADAYSLLAGRAPDIESACRLYEQGMAAAERAMGSDMFEEAGSFWGILETRPYMRALHGLAECLVDLDRPAEAAERFQEMLRLNPGDNQGARTSLVNLLIALDRDAEAEALVDRYEEDSWALMAFPRALLAFRREGDSLEARRCLKKALQSNRFVPGLLLGSRTAKPPGDYYRPGDENEAGIYLDLSGDTWESTPGALDWLQERTSPPSRPKARRKKAGGKSGGKKKRRR